MRDKPWQVIDLLTDETLAWYENEAIAWSAHAGQPVTVLYRPGRKKRVKK